MAKRKRAKSPRPDSVKTELEWAELGALTLPKRNPRGSHRLGPVSESIRKHGFGQAITINRTTGNVVAGKGRVRALRRMKRAGEPAPGGIRTEGRAWLVPALVGSWPTDREALLDLALNGGLHGSLEGDLDARVVAEILKAADEADRLALGITEPQADQYQRDQEVPHIPPAINLDGLDRTEAASLVDRQTTVRLVIPPKLAERARALVRDGVTAAELLTRGVDALELGRKRDRAGPRGVIDEKAKGTGPTQRKRGQRSATQTAKAPPRRKSRPRQGDH